MSSYAISKFLFSFNTSPEMRSKFQHDAGAALADYQLTDEERLALKTFDFKWLYDRGVHPLQLTALANGSGIPIPKYLEAIRG